MIKVNNLSGESVAIDVDGTSYVLPNGKAELSVTEGATFTITLNGGGGPPPPPGPGSTFTEYGNLEIWDDAWEFTPGESPLFYFMEGLVLGILVFGTAYIIRIVKNVARQSPDV